MTATVHDARPQREEGFSSMLNQNERRILEMLRQVSSFEVVNGETPLSPDDWQELKQLASRQEVLLFLAEEFRRLAPNKDCEENLESQMVQIRKTQDKAFIDCQNMYLSLEEYDLKPVLIGGLLFRQLLGLLPPQVILPEEILINRYEEPIYDSVFKSLGFVLEDVKQNDLKTYYRAENNLRAKVYTRIFPYGSEDYYKCGIYFSHSLQRTIKMRGKERDFQTLSQTDNILRMLLFAYKAHQDNRLMLSDICSILIFTERFCSAVNWLRILNACNDMGCSHFVAALYGFASMYLRSRIPPIFSGFSDGEYISLFSL